MSLNTEAQLNNKYVICDNIDLETILQEYESFFLLKFQKYPNICKKNVSNSELIEIKRTLKKEIKKDCHCQKNNQKPVKFKNFKNTRDNHDLSGFDLTVLPLSTSKTENLLQSNSLEEKTKPLHKPLSGYGICGEWKEFAEVISKEICNNDLNTHWSDIKGLETAKQLLKEAVVYPIKYPELFKGILSPWKGLLLYGPPGTGKTLLAKAVATECKTTFFNISASSIVSKWRGDSEKLIRVLFEVARYHAPSTIFLDEIDALASRRDGSFEHEASRRLKAELLIQLDGLANSEDRIFLLATSNIPWDLDPAMLRRLEKRILVDLPTCEARRAMLLHYLPPIISERPSLKSDLDYEYLSEKMDGYSGSDIKLVCKEASMQAMRAALMILETEPDTELPTFELDVIKTNDVEAAISRTKPSAVNLHKKYKNWQIDFESM
uniref:AAA+ ATPase domain-containing protein n=1 Tax=Clastoptera arizonana TaxID=38151 RepID=A0A1B6CRR9_9HEMI